MALVTFSYTKPNQKKLLTQKLKCLFWCTSENPKFDSMLILLPNPILELMESDNGEGAKAGRAEHLQAAIWVLPPTEQKHRGERKEDGNRSVALGRVG